METTTISTAVEVRAPRFSAQEEHALVGFLGGYTGLTREAYALDLRQYVGAQNIESDCSVRAAPTSKPLAGTLRHRVGRGRLSRGDCARPRVSTATPKKKD